MASALSMSFRKAAKRDVPQLASLYASTFAQWIDGNTAPAYMDSMVEDPHFDFTVAEDRPGHIAGFIVSNHILLETHAFVNVDVMAVDTAFRRHGLGKALMDKCEESANQAGARMMTLQVVEYNEPAKKLYESLGYNVIERTENYYLDHSAALQMLKLMPAFFAANDTAAQAAPTTEHKQRAPRLG